MPGLWSVAAPCRILIDWSNDTLPDCDMKVHQRCFQLTHYNDALHLTVSTQGVRAQDQKSIDTANG